MAKVHIKNTTDNLSTELAEFVITQSRESIEKSGSFTIAISGGSLPSILAAKLKLKEYNTRVDWSKWSVWFVDERYVSTDHPDSNYKAVKDSLFSFVEIPDSNIHIPDFSLPLQECAVDYQKKMIKEFGEKLPSLDLVLLGVGPDGHTASLFPFHPLLKESNLWISSISDSPKPPPQRITFTYPLINNAKCVAFVATGDAKKEILQRIIEVDDVPVGELPSKLVRPTSCNLHWFVDAPAASLLRKQ